MTDEGKHRPDEETPEPRSPAEKEITEGYVPPKRPDLSDPEPEEDDS